MREHAKPQRIVALILLLACAAPALAQRSLTDPRADADRRAIYGVLQGTMVSVDIAGAPLRDVVRALGVAADVSITGRYATERRPGLDPEIPIRLRVEQASIDQVLDLVLDQAAAGGWATWQVRRGYVEVGPKARLVSAPASISLLYDAGDFGFFVPYFGDGETMRISRELFERHKYKRAAVGGDIDPDPLEDTAELFARIIEPGNWAGSRARAGGKVRAAAIRIIRNPRGLIVDAPDFIHRQVTPVAGTIPSSVDPETRRARSAEASRPACRVEVLSIGQRPPFEVGPLLPVAGIDHAAPEIVIIHPPAMNRVERDRLNAHLLDALTKTTIEGSWRNVPLRQFLHELRDRLRIAIVGRYLDDPVGHGLEPDALVTIESPGRIALDVLREALEQGALADPYTWQLRNGYVEVGTVERLSEPAARETRVHDIADVSLHAPRWGSEPRLRPDILALDLVGEIVENIEPGSWDWGQVDYDDADAGRAGLLRQTGRPADEAQDAAPQPSRPSREYRPSAYPALIRYWRHYAIIHAPDFIQRQVAGYE